MRPANKIVFTFLLTITLFVLGGYVYFQTIQKEQTAIYNARYGGHVIIGQPDAQAYLQPSTHKVRGVFKREGEFSYEKDSVIQVTQPMSYSSDSWSPVGSYRNRGASYSYNRQNQMNLPSGASGSSSGSYGLISGRRSAASETGGSGSFGSESLRTGSPSFASGPLDGIQHEVLADPGGDPTHMIPVGNGLYFMLFLATGYVFYLKRKSLFYR